MNRRSFLRGLFGVAPAIIMTPGLLMPIKPALVMAPAELVATVTPASALIGFDEGDFVHMRENGAIGFLRGGKVVYEFVHDLAGGPTWDQFVERGAPGTAAKVADALLIGPHEDQMGDLYHGEIAVPYRGLARGTRWDVVTQRGKHGKDEA